MNFKEENLLNNIIVLKDELKTFEHLKLKSKVIPNLNFLGLEQLTLALPKEAANILFMQFKEKLVHQYNLEILTRTDLINKNLQQLKKGE